MNENNDRNILVEAERDKHNVQAALNELERQCVSLRVELAEMEIVVNYLRSKINGDNSNNEEKKIARPSQYRNGESEFGEVSYIDATIKILEETGTALHISRIINEISKRYGKTTNARNLSGNIGKDRLDRFVNLGGNVWDLTSRYTPEQLEDLRGKRKRGGARTPTLLFSSNEGGN